MFQIKVYPGKRTHHLLFMFYPFQSGDEVLTRNPPTYLNMLACPSVLNGVNKNRQKFEPYAEIVNKAFANFNHSLQSNPESHG